jgi:anti-sigma factor RsiW
MDTEGTFGMDCFDWETLSRYQDGSLEECESRLVADHLMGCFPCRDKLRSLGKAGLFLRIALASRKHASCLTADELGAYLSGRIGAGDRERLEAHLLRCPTCLHEVAVLSDPGMLRRSADSPVPDAASMERFRRLAADRTVRRPVLHAMMRRGLSAAAAVLLLTMTLAPPLSRSPSHEPAVPPAALASAPGTVRASAGDYLVEVSLTSDSTPLRPDRTDIARFAGDVGLILREIERVAERPRAESLELVREDILSSGIVESIAGLAESTRDYRDLAFLSECQYVMTWAVKVEQKEFDRQLKGLVSEIRRLNLIETARLVEMEGGPRPWLAGL